MKGKVNCTCGWSWNKSDSSAKDMYICHECGRDNSNNMKNGGEIPIAQKGAKKFKVKTDERLEGQVTRDTLEDRNVFSKNQLSFKKPVFQKMVKQIQKEAKNRKVVVFAESPKNMPTYNMWDDNVPAELKPIREELRDTEAKLDSVKMTDKGYKDLFNKSSKLWKLSSELQIKYGSEDPRTRQAWNNAARSDDDLHEYVSNSVPLNNKIMPYQDKIFSLMEKFDKSEFNPKIMDSTFYKEAQNVKDFYKRTDPNTQVDVVQLYGDKKLMQRKLKGMTPFDKFAIFGHSGDMLAGISNDEIAEYLSKSRVEDCYFGSCGFESHITGSPFENLKGKTLNYRPSGNYWYGFNPAGETFDEAMWSRQKKDSRPQVLPIKQNVSHITSKLEDGGWLDNYNDSQASAPEGMVGDGFSNVGRNYSPAWGGQFENGGLIPMAQNGERVPATRADSLNVYNSTRAVDDYFKNKGYIKEKVKDTKRHKENEKHANSWINEAQKILNAAKKQPLIPGLVTQASKNKEIAEARGYLKSAQKSLSKTKDEVNPKNYLQKLKESRELFDTKGKDVGTYVDKQNNLVEGKPSAEEFYAPIDENTFNQREQSQGFLDLRSPMPLYDERITPQDLSVYKSPESIAQDELVDRLMKTKNEKERAKLEKQLKDIKYADHVEMYEYDPLAVMPFDILKEHPELIPERIKKYGTEGIPTSVIQQHPEWGVNLPIKNTTQPQPIKDPVTDITPTISLTDEQVANENGMYDGSVTPREPNRYKYVSTEGGDTQWGYITNPEDLDYYKRLQKMYNEGDYRNWMGIKNKVEITPEYDMNYGSWDVTSVRYNMQGPSDRYNYNLKDVDYKKAMQMKAAADAYNADIEKRYGPQNKYPSPKSAEEAAKRFKQLRWEFNMTPSYQMGGNVYPVNYVPQAQEGKKTYSYPLRDKLYPGEDEYFKANPHVTGMAAEDNQVIINPYSGLTEDQKQGIRMNEAARLAMRDGYERPTFELTPEQKEFFNTINDGKPYSTDEQDIRETIIGRILSGDSSAGNVTPEQKKYAEELQKVLKFQMGGSLPGATGNMYARIGAPSNGPYAKKTMASAQDGKKLNPFTYPKADYNYSTNPFLVRDPQFNIFVGGINPTYSTDDFSIGASMVGVGNEHFQKIPADYGIRGSYNPTDNLSINANISKDNIGAGLSYRFQNGGEMKYYQEGLDWKPKTISKNGGWLDQYDEAQDGGEVAQDGWNAAQLKLLKKIKPQNNVVIDTNGVKFDMSGKRVFPNNRALQILADVWERKQKGIPSPQFSNVKVKDERAEAVKKVDNTRTASKPKVTDIKKLNVRNKTEAELAEIKRKNDEAIAAERKAVREKADANVLNQWSTELFDSDNWTRQNMEDAAAGLESKFRFSDEPNFFDDWINPASWAGRMAANLGAAPNQIVQQDSMMPLVSSIAEPVVSGAIGPIVGPYISKAVKPIKKAAAKAALPILETAKSVNNKIYNKAFDLASSYRANNKNIMQKAIEAANAGNAWSREWYSNPIIQARYNKWINPANNFITPKNAITESNMLASINIPKINLNKGYANTLAGTIARNNLEKLLVEGKFTNPVIGGLGSRNMVGRYSHGFNDALVNIAHPGFNKRIFGKGYDVANTFVHENIHALTKGDFGFKPEFLQRFKDPFARTAEEIAKKQLTKHQKYLVKPTEVHARIGELRRTFGLSPETVVDDKLMDNIIKQGLKGKTSVEKDFFKLIKDKVKFKELMNTAPAGVIGVGLGAGALQQQREGGIIKDDRGQWDHPGEITEIGSNQITMQGVPYPVLGISDTGDVQMMYPEEEYEFDGEKVTEFPMAQNGIKQELNTRVKDNTSVYNKKPKKNILKEKMITSGTPVVPINKGNWLNRLIAENITPYGYFMSSTPTMAPNKELDDITWESSNKMKQLDNKYGYKRKVNESTGTYSDVKVDEIYTKINNPDLHKKELKKIRDDRNKKLLAITKNTSDNKLSGKLKGTPRPQRLNASQDALNLHQGIPQKYNSFVYSEYKPSKSKENKQYYSLAPQYEDEIRQDLFERRNADFIKSKDKFRQVKGSHIADASLKDYQYSKGEDEKGAYIAYYDVNDYGNILDILPNANPFEIYGRIYYDKKTGKPIAKHKNGGEYPMAKNGLRQEQKGLVNLDNLLNFTNYNKPQPGGWLNKYN